MKTFKTFPSFEFTELCLKGGLGDQTFRIVTSVFIPYDSLWNDFRIYPPLITY